MNLFSTKGRIGRLEYSINSLLPAVILFLLTGPAAGPAQDEPVLDPEDPANYNPYRIELLVMSGFGFDDKTIATNENGTPLEFSFGGGAALAIGFAYNIAYGFELEFALGYQSTPYYGHNNDLLEEGFNRVIFTFAQKARIKLSRRGYLKGGLGIGWFGNPRLVINCKP
jgi:hypothetical protein